MENRQSQSFVNSQDNDELLQFNKGDDILIKIIDDQSQDDFTHRNQRKPILRNSSISGFSYNNSRSSSTIITVQSFIQQDGNSIYPQLMTCSHCLFTGISIVKREHGRTAFTTSGVCCLLGCWAGCQCIPLCLENFKDSKHICRNCGETILKVRPH